MGSAGHVSLSGTYYFDYVSRLIFGASEILAPFNKTEESGNRLSAAGSFRRVHGLVLQQRTSIWVSGEECFTATL